jgi:hypothetical protein
MMSLATRAFAATAGLFVVMALMLFPRLGRSTGGSRGSFLRVYFGGSVALTASPAEARSGAARAADEGGPLAEERLAQKVIMRSRRRASPAPAGGPCPRPPFGWSHMPSRRRPIGDALVLLGGLVHLTRVPRKQLHIGADRDWRQRVISTGPYAQVRHPMYARRWCRWPAFRSRSAPGGACWRSPRWCRRCLAHRRRGDFLVRRSAGLRPYNKKCGIA